MRFFLPLAIAALLVTACSASGDDVASDTLPFSGVVASVDAADAPGAFQVDEREYALAPTADDGVIQPAPGQPAATLTQVAGRLYLPKADGPRPVVVLLHGNHSTCGFFATDADRTKDPRIDIDATYTETGACPRGWEVAKSYLGYSYVAHHLASHGFVVAAVDANRGVTAGSPGDDRDGGLIEARGRLVLRNLELFSQWNASAAGTSILDGLDMRGRFDLSQIGMMGHSRGGEGVRAAYNIYLRDLFSDFFHWKTAKPALGFRAIFEIGSVDFGHPADRNGTQTAYYDAPGLAWNALIPGCDGDVSDFEGVNSYTRMLQGAGTAPHSVVVAWGGNHNFFNTEWQTSDAPACRGSQTALFQPPVLHNFTTTAAPPEGCDQACWADFQTQQLPYGVRGSSKQTDIARILMTAFFEAHLGAGNADMARVFDPKYDLPPRLNAIAPLWRDFVSPGTASSSWPSGANVDKVSGADKVTVSPMATVLEKSTTDAIATLRAQLPAGTRFGAPPFRTTDAVSLQWSRSADSAPHASLALPAVPADSEYLQLVVSDMPQDKPCLVESTNASCAGDGTPLDFQVRLVNDDGTASDPHRVSEFGSLVPYLRSNIVGYGLYPGEGASDPSICYLSVNEPVFDTVVIPLKGFTSGGQPFAVTASTHLRIDFDPATEGTISVRNVHLFGKISPPVTAQRR